MGQRLIDANALPITTLTDGGYWTKDVVYKQDIDKAPTVDAVPVIRCRECKHAWIHPCGYVFCHRDGRNAYEMTFNLNSFCSYGERSVCDG